MGMAGFLSFFVGACHAGSVFPFLTGTGAISAPESRISSTKWIMRRTDVTARRLGRLLAGTAILFGGGSVLGQGGAVLQRWTDWEGPVASPAAADTPAAVMERGNGVYTAGTRTRSAGGTEILLLWHHKDGDGNPPDPNIPRRLASAAWPELPNTYTASTHSMTIVPRAGIENKARVCVLGRQDGAGGWQDAVVLAYDGVDNAPGPHSLNRQWTYIYNDGLPRDHEPVSIHSTPNYVGIVVNSSEYVLNGKQHPATSTIVLIDPGTGVEVNRAQTQYPAVDMRMDFQRVWVAASLDAPSKTILLLGYDTGTLTGSITGTWAMADRDCHPVRLRHVQAANQSELAGELVIVGYTTPSPGAAGTQDLLTLRWSPGALGVPFFRWHHVYDRGGVDGPMDVAGISPVLGPEEPPPATMMASGSGDGGELFIYVVGYSEAGNGTTDYTTLCYREPTLGGTGVLHWDAHYAEQVRDDSALAVSVSAQLIQNTVRAVAVVAGVRENAFGHLDWATVKYDDERPFSFPQVQKASRWSIHQPQNPLQSSGHDVPAGVTHTVSNGLLRVWNTGVGHFVNTGADIGTIYYEELQP
jgi:hypothetical protein